MPDVNKYNQIFDYLSAPNLPQAREDAVVFGRNDPLVAQALGDLIIPGLVETAIITGGIGKDSGDILSRGFKSEAEFLQYELTKDSARRNYTLPYVTLEESATNGGENARFSIALLAAKSQDLTSATAVAHATSARRLSESLKFEIQKLAKVAPNIHTAPSNYSFNGDKTTDRDEAAAELLRIADWPAKGWLGEQTDVPENLVDFVRDQHGEAPTPVADWQAAVLRKLPPKLRLRVINFAAAHGRK